MSEEPQDTGALVRDRDGFLWARNYIASWWCLSVSDPEPFSWAQLAEHFGPLTVVRP